MELEPETCELCGKHRATRVAARDAESMRYPRFLEVTKASQLWPKEAVLCLVVCV